MFAGNAPIWPAASSSIRANKDIQICELFLIPVNNLRMSHIAVVISCEPPANLGTVSCGCPLVQRGSGDALSGENRELRGSGPIPMALGMSVLSK